MSRFAIMWVVLSLSLPIPLPPWLPMGIGEPQYPDLVPLTPRALQFDQVEIDGTPRTVLRFTSIVWNQGEGRLDVRGESDPSTQTTVVYQRLYDQDGAFVKEHQVGEFVWHEAHNHWHFGDFAEYQLWTRSDYDQWLASGRMSSSPSSGSIKTSFCIRDDVKVEPLPGSPNSPVYQACDVDLQGISVGWGDRYRFDLPEQWIVVGDSVLPDGDYALRVVADPTNRLYESPDRSSDERESPQANEAVRFFRVTDGTITLLNH